MIIIIIIIIIMNLFYLYLLGNNDCQVYFLLTSLVARSYSNETAMSFKSNFHWINDVNMIKEIKKFKKYRPSSKLLDDLLDEA